MKILFTGDIYPGGQAAEILNDNSKNTTVEWVRSITAQYDHAISNLEAPLCKASKTYQPIIKTGPNICGYESSVEGIKAMGFNIVSLANNHIMDFGDEGLFDTLKICKRNNIKTYGAGTSLTDARKALVVSNEKTSVSLLAFAENEFGNTNGNYAGGNPLKLTDNFRDIQKAKSQSDYVVISLHGSHEHYQLPSPAIKDICRFYVEAGADAVIVHHTHCFSGYEVYNNAPIFYSLGNFIFDSVGPVNNSKLWSEAYIVGLELGPSQPVKFNIIPIIQYPEYKGVRAMTEDEKRGFDSELAELNAIIADDDKLQASFDELITQNEKFLLSAVEKYPHIIQKFVNRKLLPSSITSRQAALLLNIIRCEAHRDILMGALKKRLYK